MTSLYEECVKRGIPVDSHNSDLYIPATDETRDLLNQFGQNKRPFVNQLDGSTWYDVAFHYEPYWTARKGSPIDYS